MPKDPEAGPGSPAGRGTVGALGTFAGTCRDVLPRGSSACSAHEQGWSWALGWGGQGVARRQPGQGRKDKEPEGGCEEISFWRANFPFLLVI